MKKDKKDTAELLGQIEYDEAATSAINADMAVLLALSALELIAGFFMNGYSVIADCITLFLPHFAQNSAKNSKKLSP